VLFLSDTPSESTVLASGNVCVRKSNKHADSLLLHGVKNLTSTQLVTFLPAGVLSAVVECIRNGFVCLTADDVFIISQFYFRICCKQYCSLLPV